MDRDQINQTIQQNQSNERPADQTKTFPMYTSHMIMIPLVLIIMIIYYFCTAFIGYGLSSAAGVYNMTTGCPYDTNITCTNTTKFICYSDPNLLYTLCFLLGLLSEAVAIIAIILLLFVCVACGMVIKCCVVKCQNYTKYEFI